MGSDAWGVGRTAEEVAGGRRSQGAGAVVPDFGEAVEFVVDVFVRGGGGGAYFFCVGLAVTNAVVGVVVLADEIGVAIGEAVF